jgi:hypothetical protein
LRVADYSGLVGRNSLILTVQRRYAVYTSATGEKAAITAEGQSAMTQHCREGVSGSFCRSCLEALPVMGLFCAVLSPVSIRAQDKAEMSKVAAEWGRGATGEVHFVLEEANRRPKGDSTEIAYQPITAGFPAGKIYSVWLRHSGSLELLLLTSGYIANADGELICVPDPPANEDRVAKALRQAAGRRACGPDAPETFRQWNLSVVAYHKGEPFDMAIFSTDHSIRAFAKVYPFPIEAKDGACHLVAEATREDFRQFRIYGEGFSAGENVATEMNVEGETVQGHERIDADGRFEKLLDLRKKRGSSGLAAYTVVAQTCKPTVSYEWGALARQPQ